MDILSLCQGGQFLSITMKQFFRDFMSYHRRERNGAFVLLGIIVLMIIYLNFSHYLFSSEKIDFSKYEQELKLFSDSVKSQSDSIEREEQQNKGNNYYTSSDKSNKVKGERFNFNPNNLPESEWKRMGLSDKQIYVIKHYESKGGQFRSKADVKKMYCIQEKLYLSLEPYIIIPEKKRDTLSFKYPKKDTERPVTKKPEPEILVVELNSSDSLSLIRIRGIKGFYSKKIIEHRAELGGYASKEQLMELWKFDKEKYDAVEKYVTVDVSKIKKININTCTSAELKHPYLSWNAVNGIISYRSKHGKFIKIDDIKKTDLVDDETYRKIAPYLKTE